MSLIISLFFIFLFGGFILKLAFGMVGLAFRLVFGVLQLVFCLLGWIFGGGLIALILFAVVGTLICVPFMLIFGKR